MCRVGRAVADVSSACGCKICTSADWQCARVPIGSGPCLTRQPCCRRNWWLLPMLSKDDREWLLTETLDAEVQPLVYNTKMSAAHMV